MFDKNAFKEAFHYWVQQNPAANEAEAREFCQTHIPPNVYLQYYWLVDQSVEWFKWIHRSNRWSAADLAGGDEDEVRDSSNADGDYDLDDLDDLDGGTAMERIIC